MECFIWRLSFLVVRKVDVSVKGPVVGSMIGSVEVVVVMVGLRAIFARVDVRFLGAIGACGILLEVEIG